MMYRNKIEVTSIEGITVDAGSLWQMQNGILVLEDEDQYATHQLTDAFCHSDPEVSGEES